MDAVRAKALDRLIRHLDGATFLWMVAGGWAIDLELRRQLRERSDSDIVVFREELPELLRFFQDWEMTTLRDGRLVPEKLIDPGQLDPSVRTIKIESQKDTIQALVTDRRENFALYAKDNRVSIPMDQLEHCDPLGRVYVAPEWQLLHKAEAPKETDEQDLQYALERMNERSREWLKQAVAQAHPESSWLARL
ncbi:MAG: nucleotidyltransferase domain-containing protein [Fimbriimonadaceae bacterium]